MKIVRRELKRKVTKEEADLFKRAVHFTISVADKYKDERAYQAALVGLYVGLNICTQKDLEYNLETYLHWYIKTSIEYTLGYDTEDIRIWESKKNSKV